MLRSVDVYQILIGRYEL